MARGEPHRSIVRPTRIIVPGGAGVNYLNCTDLLPRRTTPRPTDSLMTAKEDDPRPVDLFDPEGGSRRR
jgi:hypothetical protein